MRLLLTVVDDVGDTFDVQIEAEPDTPVGTLARALAGTGTGPTSESEIAAAAESATGSGGGPGSPIAVRVDGVLVPPETTLQESPLRDAAVVRLGHRARTAPQEPGGLVEVRVVSGTGAGSVHRLDIGEYHIGLTPDGVPRVDRSATAAGLAGLRVGPGGRCTLLPYDDGSAGKPVSPARSTAAPLVLLDREEVAEERTWPAGGQLAVGGSLLELALTERPDAAVQPSEDGAGLDYNRPPRLLPPKPGANFRLPSPPAEPERRPLPYITAIAPLVLAAGGVFLFGRLSALLFGLLTPVVVIGNYVMSRRSGKESYATRLKKYEEARARIETEADEAVVAERTARRSWFPDPAAVLLTAVGPRRRLWERRTSDADFLELRVGTADQPSDVVLQDPTVDEHRRQLPRVAFDVPVTVGLRGHRVLGIAGRGEAVRAVARWVVGQAAILHSPRDLQLYVLTGPGGERDWAWVRWLPHVRPRPGQDTVITVGTDTESAARRVSELTALITARTAAGATTGQQDVLVVLDGARRLRSLPGIVQILRDGPSVGVHAVCLDDEERLLPEECQAVVVEEPGGTLRIGRSGVATLTGVRPDRVTADWCRSVGRALGPLRDPGGSAEEASVLPGAARLLDVLSLDPPTAEAVAGRWRAGGRTTSAVVGVSLDGPFALDLRRDGPHGLVAGTTGSGKSELLQTLVASLAVGNRPDAMTFVLVDYKGGSAFKDCVSLPHTVGMVTDLDAHLVERALTSLSAELKRREHILAGAGAKDIEDYIDLLVREPHRPPLPRLLIVIDEFASMVRELPDFVKGLVNIAQRGRSLGIHLILATQRPGGVVSPEIRANTNLRIALRVTDRSESQDVINSPESAGISKSHPGRAHVRLGQTSLVPFQAGRVGGRRPGAAADTSAPAPWVVPVGWGRLGAPLPPRPRVARTESDTAVTDLADLVEAVRGANRELGVPQQHSPWLPALPTTLVLDDLPAPASGPYDLPPVPYGLVDLPAEQAQLPLSLDLSAFGHLHLVGSPRAGRSQTLRSIAGALARAHSCADLHLYGIDCGNGALLALEALPHTGAVVQRTQPERLARLLSRLTAEVARRQELLAARGAADLPELRSALPAGERPAHIVVLLDRWEVFDKTLADYDSGSLLNGILGLLREGASVGVHVVVAGDRTLFSSRLSSTTEEKLVLRLNEKSEYSMIGVPQRSVPDDIPSGRALRATDKAEVQIALLAPDTTGQAQAAALHAIGAVCAERDAEVPRAARPFRVDLLPDRVSGAEAAALLPVPRPGPLWAMVGVGGDELAAVGADLALSPSFVVGGPARSGRSTLLLTMALSLLDAGTRIVVAAPRRSPLRELAGREGVVAVFTDADISREALERVLADHPGPLVVVIDDADGLQKSESEPVLGAIARTGAETGRGLILAGQTDRLMAGFSGWFVDVRRNRQGALLSPQAVGDGELIGGKVPRSRIGGGRPGRALFHNGDGRLRTVQVPQTEL
ncbi:FtsK/SpoIIIE domain-containing protein [Streptomyces microflavus]|uniref:FtsK/SpoIIIE domain-containing protein n=1 Tax=Streptomyces microflavus TaxID=1919 RepID=UPI00386B42D8|nr:FtsK/SpoIIIE domain-containing protein [Streptomyces microflavus]WST13085.1 FtsK/SpoIIIE domain-containing protein [Streptomyces microflavus]